MTTADRGALAARQVALLDALAGAPVPDGVDAGRLAVQAAALARRARRDGARLTGPRQVS